MTTFNIDNFDNSAVELQNLIDENHLEIKKLLLITSKSYANFVVPYQLLGEKLNNFITPIYHIDSVCNSENTQRIYDECLPIISLYYTSLSQNEYIYSAFQDIQYSSKSSLSIEQNKVLLNELRDF
ncbi:MAG: M3 family peptidase, partial [Arcobacter sp.]|nr:M3 family peptidase [Arcobacter sp.]